MAAGSLGGRAEEGPRVRGGVRMVKLGGLCSLGDPVNIGNHMNDPRFARSWEGREPALCVFSVPPGVLQYLAHLGT